MKRFMAFCCLLFSFAVSNAQDYRLTYDPSTLPELYGNTVVFLEQKAGNGYQEVTRGYKLSTNDATLSRGNKLSYDPGKLPASGAIRFMALINGSEVPLTLYVPVLKDIHFNFYSDSIKPVLNFYVNVEGEFTNGKVYPLTTSAVSITSDHGSMAGNEWVAPKDINFEKVTFTATNRADASVHTSATVYMKRSKDPRDAEGYEEPGSSERRR